MVPGAAARDAEKVAVVPIDEFGAKDYRAQMVLKQDHASRPIWIVSLVLENYNFIWFPSLFNIPCALITNFSCQTVTYSWKRILQFINMHMTS